MSSTQDAVDGMVPNERMTMPSEDWRCHPRNHAFIPGSIGRRPGDRVVQKHRWLRFFPPTAMYRPAWHSGRTARSEAASFQDARVPLASIRVRVDLQLVTVSYHTWSTTFSQRT